MSILHKNFKSSSNPNKLERKFYKVWIAMIYRCSGKNLKDKKWYFDSGIKVCDRWKRFEYFFIDMWDEYIIHRNMFNGDTQLDRKNNKKGYNKINCRWITSFENKQNRRDSVIIDGKTISEWSNLLNIKRSTIYDRYMKKMYTIKEILSPSFLTRKRRKTVVTG